MVNTLANARFPTIDGDAGFVSTCANNYLSGYFIYGSLPPKGTVCLQDEAQFSSGSGS